MRHSCCALATCSVFFSVLLAGCDPVNQIEIKKIKSDLNYSAAQAIFAGNPDVMPLLPTLLAQHPSLLAGGHASMHSDTYNSDTHDNPGPVAAPFAIDSGDMSLLFGGQCGNTLINDDGILISFCPDVGGVSIFAMRKDVDAFRKVAAPFALPNRESSLTLNLQTIMDDTSGGVYFHLDAQGRVVLVDAANHLRIVALESLPTPVDGFELQFSEQINVDLNAGLPPVAGADGVLKQPDVTDVLPDWHQAGIYWFITRQGHVGTVDLRSGSVTASEIHVLPLMGEEFLNSAAMDARGFYALSDHAAYQFVLGSDAAPQLIWRAQYDCGTMTKPGQVNQGTGTTPTLLGEYDDLITFTDNADGAINLVVYRRDGDGSAGGNTPVCTLPLFNDPVHALGNGKFRSATDNSPIGYRDSIIVENTYSYTLPTSSSWAAPGIWRIDVQRDESGSPTGCAVVWKNNAHSATAVPKLSTANGLVYFYAREPISIGAPYELTKAYYFGALNFSNGTEAFEVLVGTGSNFNDNYSPITLAPDGTAFVGVFAGIVSIK